MQEKPKRKPIIKNSNLYKAKKARNNEYYTMLDDVNREMSYYAEQLKGKYIFCNCNDFFQSAFWMYFHTHYSQLGLKGVIATTYNPGSRGECHVYLGGNDSNVKDIPIDYNGIMGVPISFMDRYNPEQFELVAIGSAPKFITPSKIYKGVVRHNLDGTTTGRHICVNQRLVIAHKDKPDSIYFTAENSNRFLTTPYQRLLIRRKGEKSEGK